MVAPDPTAAASSTALPATVDALSAAVVAQYTAAEQALLQQAATLVRRGMAAPAGSAARLALYGELRTIAQDTVTRLIASNTTVAARIARDAARHGNAYAAREIRTLIDHNPALLKTLTAPKLGDFTPHGLFAANLIGLDLQSRLDNAARRITRFTDDAYRAAVAAGATDQVLSVFTPQEAQHATWNSLMGDGVKGFTDTSGKEWNLSSYVEMATRTAAQRAWNASNQATMAAGGIQYYTVQSDGRPCKLCLPWEGAVLSEGVTGFVTEPAADRDATIKFLVRGTVEEAVAAGLQHPNCKHVLQPYLPGVTALAPARRWDGEAEQAYRNTQRLRYLERQVRSWKQRQAGALTPQDAGLARAKVREYQAAIRQHTQATDLLRRSRREQVNLGAKTA